MGALALVRVDSALAGPLSAMYESQYPNFRRRGLSPETHRALRTRKLLRYSP